MGYVVEFKESIRDYIANVGGLSDDERGRIIEGVIEELSRDTDKFLAKYPLGHESLHFRYDYIHPTYEILFTFDFIVDASHREMGVVCVEFVECTTEPMRDANA
jgi:hypothetical protein